jgi:hypothetical protein
MRKRWSMDALQALYGSKNLESLPKPRAKSKTISDCESEKRAQQRLVEWMREEGIVRYSIPNGAHVSPHHRAILVSEGLSAGAPDIVIPLMRGGYGGLYIELKREDGGAGLSPDQKKWLEFLNGEGYFATCCHGFEKAQQCIIWYINLQKKCST